MQYMCENNHDSLAPCSALIHPGTSPLLLGARIRIQVHVRYSLSPTASLKETHIGMPHGGRGVHLFVHMHIYISSQLCTHARRSLCPPRRRRALRKRALGCRTEEGDVYICMYVCLYVVLSNTRIPQSVPKQCSMLPHIHYMLRHIHHCNLRPTTHGTQTMHLFELHIEKTLGKSKHSVQDIGESEVWPKLLLVERKLLLSAHVHMYRV
jgi:hypothetical protein